MWRRKSVLLLSQRLKPTVAGHVIQLANPTVVPPPSPSHPSRLLGSRNFGRQECGSATRSLYFPSLLSVGFIKRFSSSSPSPSPSVSSSPSVSRPQSDGGEEAGPIGEVEARRLMRLVNVNALKTRLGAEKKEVISYGEFLEACKSVDIARSSKEAAALAIILDEAGVVFIYCDKVYLHPDEIVDRIGKADPLALAPEGDQEELKRLQEKKEEIDVLAHRQVRHILWTGLVLAMLQIGLFFRLTFWEFSWDVMEPIAFFTTTTGLIISYAYFVMTFRDPTYVDLTKRLFLNRQRKLFKKYNFDCARFKELQKKCKMRHDATASIKNRFGLEVELEDALHKD